MHLRAPLIGLLAAALFGWASFLSVLYLLSPFTAAPLSLMLFYASLFLALLGTFGLFSLAFTGLSESSAATAEPTAAAFRRGGLLSLMVVAGLLFQRLRVLTWWVSLLMLMIVLFLEIYFMTRRQSESGPEL